MLNAERAPMPEAVGGLRGRSVVDNSCRSPRSRIVGRLAACAALSALAIAMIGAQRAAPTAKNRTGGVATGAMPQHNAPREQIEVRNDHQAQALPRPAFWDQGADVVGGYVSAYVCLRVLDGVRPTQLEDGSWTLQRVQLGAPAEGEQMDMPVPAPADLPADEALARDIFTRHHVTSIAPLYRFPFKRPDLARLYGLDRSYLVYVNVAAGADVRALATQLQQPPAGADLATLIERVELDSVGTIAGSLTIPNDPNFNQQWDMHNTGQTGGTNDADIDCPEAWSLHTGSASTIIAILDTGVQANHPDLNGKVISGWNTRDENNDTSDPHGHGTHCAGIAAAHGNNGVGVTGTNWNAKILAMRVTSSAGSWTSVDVAEGVLYAVDIGSANVLSMSLQSFTTPPVTNLADALAYAYDSGVLPVAAAGNSPSAGMGHVAWPARYPKCMAIAGTTNSDARWFDSPTFGSCDGPEVDVAAPAKDVFNIWRLSGYQMQTGTSMATPHVAGLAGLLRSFNPMLTVPQIEQLIRDTAEDVNAATNPGFDNFIGYGRINVRAALEAAAPSCTGDINASGTVDVDDLIAVVLSWGACPTPPPSCDADIAPPPSGDGDVNVDDLITVILNWGACS